MCDRGALRHRTACIGTHALQLHSRLANWMIFSVRQQIMSDRAMGLGASTFAKLDAGSSSTNRTFVYAIAANHFCDSSSLYCFLEFLTLTGLTGTDLSAIQRPSIVCRHKTAFIIDTILIYSCVLRKTKKHNDRQLLGWCRMIYSISDDKKA